MEQKIGMEMEVLTTFCRGTGQVCHLKPKMKADIKKSFFFNMIKFLLKLVLPNQKLIFFLTDPV